MLTSNYYIIGYHSGGLSEYSDINLLQMIGRAGRPGLDTSGCAVIMTTLQMERRYNALVSGTTDLESRYHNYKKQFFFKAIGTNKKRDFTKI